MDLLSVSTSTQDSRRQLPTIESAACEVVQNVPTKTKSAMKPLRVMAVIEKSPFLSIAAQMICRLNVPQSRSYRYCPRGVDDRLLAQPPVML
jgi:hypothetical protein